MCIDQGFGNVFSSLSPAVVSIGYHAHKIDIATMTATNPFFSIDQTGPPTAPTSASMYRTLGSVTNNYLEIVNRYVMLFIVM